MKFSEPQSILGPVARPSAAQFQLDTMVERLRSIEVAVRTEDEAVELIRAIGAGMRLLDGLNLQVSRQLDQIRANGGSLSAEDALATAGRLSHGAARRASRRAQLAAVLPRLGEAGDSGQATAENLDSVASARYKLRHNAQWVAAFDRMDATLARRASMMRPARFRQWLGRIVTMLSDDGSTDLASERGRNRFRMGRDQNGRLRGSFDLDALAGEELRGLVRAKARSLANQKKSVGEQVRYGEGLDAEAFMDLIGSRAILGRPSITAVVDLQTMQTGLHPASVKRTVDGLELPLDLVQRYLCDSWIRHVALDQGGVALAVGRSYRTATDAQRAALGVMYSSCAFCDTPFSDCEMHHIVPWESGGLTDLSNLVPLCTTHHHKVHEGRWSLRLTSNRTLLLSKPTGELWLVVPLPTAARAQLRDRIAAKRAAATAAGPPPRPKRRRSKIE